MIRSPGLQRRELGQHVDIKAPCMPLSARRGLPLLLEDTVAIVQQQAVSRTAQKEGQVIECTYHF
jgi:hypothetical protein